MFFLKIDMFLNSSTKSCHGIIWLQIKFMKALMNLLQGNPSLCCRNQALYTFIETINKIKQNSKILLGYKTGPVLISITIDILKHILHFAAKVGISIGTTSFWFPIWLYSIFACLIKRGPAIPFKQEKQKNKHLQCSTGL